MKLSKEAVTEFQAMFEKKFGVKLSDEEAESKALAFLDLFNQIYEPVPKSKEQELYSLRVGRVHTQEN